MNAIGWQVGAVLFGVSVLIIAIYIAKTLNTATKTMIELIKLLITMKRT